MKYPMSNSAYQLYCIMRKALSPEVAIGAMTDLGFEVDKTTRLIFSMLDELISKEAK